ncbi:hypothetical protein AQUCO_03700105v1 [Aquilegia coerulea]|uniref:Uncharacterized protein n=1 Tax=Aquilegia coerulea TaxID=218851 RepID=A0A2G5CTI0_AQUCA|nr:hypothetical protein AQUCO_03700105v1 [Aquilegia coerulea]
MISFFRLSERCKLSKENKIFSAITCLRSCKDDGLGISIFRVSLDSNNRIRSFISSFLLFLYQAIDQRIFFYF